VIASEPDVPTDQLKVISVRESGPFDNAKVPGAPGALAPPPNLPPDQLDMLVLGKKRNTLGMT
jgi:hypothetical protein